MLALWCSDGFSEGQWRSVQGLHQERDPSRRGRLLDLPWQLARLEGPVQGLFPLLGPAAAGARKDVGGRLDTS